MVVKELITNQTEIKVYPFDQHVPECKELDLFLFDDHFLQLQQDCLLEDKVCLHESTVLWRRPDWGGTIFQMIKNNKHVFLFDRVWYQDELLSHYKADHHNFKFNRRNTPNLMARYSCFLLYPVLPTNAEKQTHQSLLTTNDLWREASRSTDGRTLPRTMSENDTFIPRCKRTKRSFYRATT